MLWLPTLLFVASSCVQLVSLAEAAPNVVDAPPPPTSSLNNRALAVIYSVLGGDNWIRNEWWSSLQPDSTDICLQNKVFRPYGIICDGNNYVSEIHLPKNNLTGVLPSYDALFVLLPWLSVLDINSNPGITGTLPTLPSSYPLSQAHLDFLSLSGTIPDSLFTSTLTQLYLTSNQLTGTLPTTVGNSIGLQFLSVSANAALSGSVPDSICQCTQLQNLDLSDNQFTTIPGCFGTAVGSRMQVFNVGNNALDMTMPLNWCDFTSLSIFHVQNNAGLVGTLPSCIANWNRTIRDITVKSTGLSGTIPAGIFLMVELRILMLSQSEFSGEIPNQFGNLTNLTTVDFNGNPLSPGLINGSFPVTLFQLSTVQSISIQYTHIRGPIPKLDALTNLWMLSLANNPLLATPFPVELLKTLWTQPQDSRIIGMSPRELHLENTLLSGVLPDDPYFEWADLVRDMSHQPAAVTLYNTKLTGFVPAASLRWIPRESWDVNGNQGVLQGCQELLFPIGEALRNLTGGYAGRRFLLYSTLPSDAAGSGSNDQGTMEATTPPVPLPPTKGAYSMAGGEIVNISYIYPSLPVMPAPLPGAVSVFRCGFCIPSPPAKPDSHSGSGSDSRGSGGTTNAPWSWSQGGASTAGSDGSLGYAAPAVAPSNECGRVENVAAFTEAMIAGNGSSATCATPKLASFWFAKWQNQTAGPTAVVSLFYQGRVSGAPDETVWLSANVITLSFYNPTPLLVAISPDTARWEGCTAISLLGVGFANAPAPAISLRPTALPPQASSSGGGVGLAVELLAEAFVIAADSVTLVSDSLVTFVFPFSNSTNWTQSYRDTIFAPRNGFVPGLLVPQFYPAGIAPSPSPPPPSLFSHRDDDPTRDRWREELGIGIGKTDGHEPHQAKEGALNVGDAAEGGGVGIYLQLRDDPCGGFGPLAPCRRGHNDSERCPTPACRCASQGSCVLANSTHPPSSLLQSTSSLALPAVVLFRASSDRVESTATMAAAQRADTRSRQSQSNVVDDPPAAAAAAVYECLCDSGFIDDGCDACLPLHYGAACDACQCDELHGSCNATISGTGRCTCFNWYWKGDHCSENVVLILACCGTGLFVVMCGIIVVKCKSRMKFGAANAPMTEASGYHELNH